MKKLLAAITVMVIILTAAAPQAQAQDAKRLQELTREYEQIIAKGQKGQATQKDIQRMEDLAVEILMLQMPGITRAQAQAMMQGEMSAENLNQVMQTMMPEIQRRAEQDRNRLNQEEQQRQAGLAKQQQQQQEQQRQREQANNPANLVTPAGKAWVIKDNQVQGSGRAFVFKANKTYDAYSREYGVWIPRAINKTFTAAGYTAIPGVTSVMAPPSIKIDTYEDYEYSLSSNTLELTGKFSYAGRYTLADFSGPERPGGGNVVPPSGMGWFRSGRQMIFNTSGIYAAYGYPSPWVNIGHEGTYSLNQAAGKITINASVPPQPGRDTVYNYSITDFGGGNKTLRIWIENKLNEDQVYRLQAYPSGTQLPRMK